jgi:hypothetical protein
MLLLSLLSLLLLLPLPTGFGDSDKPLPSALVGPRGHFYNYDTWSQQIRDFVDEVRCAFAGHAADAAVAAFVVTAGWFLAGRVHNYDTCTQQIRDFVNEASHAFAAAAAAAVAA